MQKATSNHLLGAPVEMNTYLYNGFFHSWQLNQPPKIFVRLFPLSTHKFQFVTTIFPISASALNVEISYPWQDLYCSSARLSLYPHVLPSHYEPCHVPKQTWLLFDEWKCGKKSYYFANILVICWKCHGTMVLFRLTGWQGSELCPR